MMRVLMIAFATTLGLTGCATTSGAATGGEPDSIAYQTGPCFGACPVYTVTVNRDGTGLFEGRRFTAVAGERRFTLTPAQFRAFARQLEPLRPAGEQRYSGDVCGVMATDLPSTDVRWRSADGSEQHLYFYFGCDMERNRAIADRLRAAPDLLPIAELIGRH